MNTPEVAFVGVSATGDRVVVSDGIGDVVTLDAELREVARWAPPERRRILNDEALPPRVLALSGDGTRVVLPELQQAAELGGVEGEAGPLARSIAAVYDLSSGEVTDRAVARVGWESMAAVSAAFVPDTGEVIAVSPFGVEAPPALASTAATTGFQQFSPPSAADLVEVSPKASCPQYDAPHDPEGDPATHVAAEDPDPADGGEVGAGGFATVDFANSTYQLPCEAAESVQLVDGRHDGQGIRATVELQAVTHADMDGDGIDEAVVTLSCQGGNAFHVETALVFDGRAGAALEQVGQSVTGQFIHEVRPGTIVTRDPLPAPDDPTCCPSQYLQVEWVLADGDWVESATAPVDAPA